LIEGLTARRNVTGMIAGSMRPKSDKDTYQTHPPSLAREVSGAIYTAPQCFLLTTDRQAVCHTHRRRGNICLDTLGQFVVRETDQQFPGLDNNKKGLKQNDDGSYDIYFSPKASTGQENNWIQTVPGKGWNTILRLYGPLEPFYDKTWKPGDPKLVY
jgi:hypothetical protein